MSDLLPCPAHESHKPVTFWKRDVGGKAYRIECGYCGCKVVMPTRDQAIAAWNTRAPQEPQWQPIETAPRDGTPALVSLRNDLKTVREDLGRLEGLMIVARFSGPNIGWNLAGPFGYGGISSEWIAGWMPLPTPPEVTE